MLLTRNNHNGSQQEDLSSKNGGPEKKKCINDILTNFRKEKEQFNEKLHQLRNKLQTVQSPDSSQYFILFSEN
jgi:hypothetical protein